MNETQKYRVNIEFDMPPADSGTVYVSGYEVTFVVSGARTMMDAVGMAWSLANPTGRLRGFNLWCNVEEDEEEAASTSLDSPPSRPDPVKPNERRT